MTDQDSSRHGGQQSEHGPQFYPPTPGSAGPSGPGAWAPPPQPWQPGPGQGWQPGAPGPGHVPQYLAAGPGPLPAVPPGAPPKRSRRKWWVIGGAAILLVVALLVVTSVVWFKIAPRSPEAAADRFLTAVSQNRAHDALKLAKDPPQQRELLTDKVLRKANAAHPIKHIRTRSGSGSKVRVRYRVGGDYASSSLKTTKTSDGWKVTNGFTQVNIGSHRVPQLTINGMKATHQRFSLFPGHYRVRSGDRHLEVSDDSEQIKTEREYSGKPVKVGLELTQSGNRAARDAVVKQLRKCFPAKHTFKPGCGANTTGKLKDGGRLIKSSMKWKLRSLDVRKLRSSSFSINPDDGALASAASFNSVDWEGKCDVDGQRRPCHGEMSLGTPQADMASKPPHVTWKG